MNEFLPNEWIETVDRLALGLEPIDAGRGTRIAHPMCVLFDEEARGLPRPRVERHASCLHALLYKPGFNDLAVRLRFVESREQSPRGQPGDPRRFVPRLISFPIPDRADLDFRKRVRRPQLFPGAAYDVAAGMTGLRGRVLRGGKPVRWARIEARLSINGPVVGRAHGDDRGEFLLLIAPSASAVGDLVSPITIRVNVFAPAVPPVANPATLPQVDKFWDLPEETAPAFNPAQPNLDPISAGEARPPGYTATTGRNVDFILGQIRSENVPPFTIP